MHCRYCGAKLDPKSEFCSECGKPVETQAKGTKKVDQRTAGEREWSKGKLVLAALASFIVSIIAPYLYLYSPTPPPIAATVVSFVVAFLTAAGAATRLKPRRNPAKHDK